MVLHVLVRNCSALIAAFSLSVILTACANQAAKQDPLLSGKVPPEWQSALPATENASTMEAWWADWNDPTLLDLLRHAQQHSPNLSIASARIAQARASATASGAALWPALDLNASVIAGHYPLLPNDLRQTVTTTGLDARWEIDLFGAQAATRDSMQEKLKASEYQWHDARISLAAEVANTYVAVRSCAAQLTDITQMLASQHLSQRLQQEKIAAGFISATELAQYRAVLASTASQQQQQQSECNSMLKSLVTLIDMPEPELRERLKAGPDAIPETGNFIVDTLPAKVLLKRPDIRAAMHQLMASAAEINAAQAKRYPSISLLGSINLYGIRIEGSSANLQGWSFGPSLNLPLFDAGARKADVEHAQARHAQAQAEFRQISLAAIQEVEVAMLRLDLANRHLEQHQHIQAAQDQAMQAAQANWQFGSASLLEREEARRQQLAASEKNWQLQRLRASARIALYKALGGDWQANEDPPTKS